MSTMHQKSLEAATLAIENAMQEPHTNESLARAALVAAAQQQVIQTADKLHGLPELAAFLAPNGLVAQRRPDGLWWAAGGTRGIPEMDIVAFCPTVTVIHLGEELPSRAEKDPS